MKNILKKTSLVFAFITGLICNVATSQTVEKVADINPAGNSSPSGFAKFNNLLYFMAFTDTYGYELMVSDGTEDGTTMVKDIFPGSEGSYPRELTEYNGKIFFRAKSSNGNSELWVSDGTEAGTVLFKDISSSGSSDPSGFKVLNNLLYFSAIETSVNALWVTDGTLSGTQKIKSLDIYSNSHPSCFVEYANKLYFAGSIDGGSYKLWETDGTTAGTKTVSTVEYPDYLTEYNGKLYFSGYDNVNGHELWVTDGTMPGTAMTQNINPLGSSTPGDLTVFNNFLYFSADDGVNGTELWRSDGSETGTAMFKDIDNTGSSYPEYLTVYGNYLFFSASQPDVERELWFTDGINPDNCTLFKEFNVGGSGDPSYLTVSQNNLYFTARTETNGFELFYNSEAITDSTFLIMPGIAPNFSPCFETDEFFDLNGVVYFAADYSGIGFELYKIINNDINTSAKPTNKSLLTLYPNPAHSTLNITLAEPATIYIYNFSGKQVLCRSLDPDQTIDVSMLKPGLYLVRDEKNSIVATFIKN